MYFFDCFKALVFQDEMFLSYLITEALRKFGIFEQMKQYIEGLPDTIAGLFGMLLEEWSKEYGERLFHFYYFFSSSVYIRCKRGEIVMTPLQIWSKTHDPVTNLVQKLKTPL